MYTRQRDFVSQTTWLRNGGETWCRRVWSKDHWNAWRSHDAGRLWRQMIVWDAAAAADDDDDVVAFHVSVDIAA